MATPTTGIRRACASTFAVVTPTRRPVKRPGPIPTQTAAIVSSATPPRGADVVDRGDEILGVATPRRELELGQGLTVATDGDAHPRRRGVEAEEVHDQAASNGAITAARSLARAAQVTP